ncbi:hypothetical protein PF003_g26854 [Phytophthora fragariae]|nr:hypothetical protein PF003_g26854 [Phytophthora fragariae]
MVFVAPKLSTKQAIEATAGLLLAARCKRKRFLCVMRFLMSAHCYRLRGPPPRIDTRNGFDNAMDDATARTKFNFTIPQLRELAAKLHLPMPCIITPERDTVPTLEALAMLCRRLKEPSTLFTVANEFGRSPAAYSRICKHTVHELFTRYKERLYFNRELVVRRIEGYCSAVRAKGAPLNCCWAFIDGTKQYVCRPSARDNPASAYENLQRALYNGHPRRHCFNWQGVTTPDGIIVSMYGPVEGRRHDSTMLNMSCLLDELASDEVFQGKVMYGDPAYGCSDFMCCPFPDTSGSAAKAAFNARMSSVREVVEWGFGRVKTQWSFLNWDKKLRSRQAAVGKLSLVAVLLTNAHTCMQPAGNQISMYFGLKPPSLDQYLGLE